MFQPETGLEIDSKMCILKDLNNFQETWKYFFKNHSNYDHTTNLE